jgi:hypothetical protein
MLLSFFLLLIWLNQRKEEIFIIPQTSNFPNNLLLGLTVNLLLQVGKSMFSELFILYLDYFHCFL